MIVVTINKNPDEMMVEGKRLDMMMCWNKISLNNAS